MNARAIALLAADHARWAKAGDQFFVDLDLSQDHLPAGTRLAIGGAIVEVTAAPHLGCKQFAMRYGADAVKWVNSVVGKQLRLRGLNARVVQPGAVRVGDAVKKL
jgi:MOSC domain-containing protein YiiM